MSVFWEAMVVFIFFSPMQYFLINRLIFKIRKYKIYITVFLLNTTTMTKYIWNIYGFR